MRSIPSFLRLLFAAALLLSACGPTRRDDDGDSSSGGTTCGDAVVEGSEACDSGNLKNATCTSLGLGTGNLACKADCSDFDTSGCSDACAKDCSGHHCGPDPKCGLSCGTCVSTMTCNANGTCETLDPHAPVIQSLGTNVPSITQGGSVTITAVVTDPDGISDLAGGTLRDLSGATYGPFTQSAPGSYTFVLSWNALNSVTPIAFSGSGARQVAAEFFDSKGKRASGAITIRLTCPGGDNGTATATNGQCSVTCFDYARKCNGTCIDVRSDTSNCGSCGHYCEQPSGGTVACENSRCVSGCPSGKTDCSGRCVDLNTSVDYCGSCTNACPPAPSGGSHSCVSGKCQSSCPSGRTLCGNRCVDLTSDVGACGSCDNACPPVTGGTIACVHSQCTATCPSGETECGGDCTNLQYDHFNCGSCGHSCGDYSTSYYACSGGHCATTQTCKSGNYACGTVCCNYNTYKGACHYGAGGLTCGA